MFSLNFRKSGWLVRYLIYRASTPFPGPEPYFEFTGEDFGEEIFDELLYLEVKGNGMFLGCPVISKPVQNLANKLNFQTAGWDYFTLSGDSFLHCLN